MKHGHVVITGQPGIGKTTFLLYLLLRRLENKLPTALQLGSRCYFLFDEVGVSRHPIDSMDPRLVKCWALADSNTDVTHPCEVFRAKAQRVFQATSPEPANWLGWAKQRDAEIYIMDLPSSMEIAAVMKENGLDPSYCLPYVRKWGPCVRTIIKIVKAGGNEMRSQREKGFQAAAETAARKIGADSSRLQSLASEFANTLDGVHSTLLFVHSTRKPSPEGEMRDTFNLMIPTEHLAEIFERERAKSTNQSSLEFYKLLSFHSFTKTAAGWTHECNMHNLLCTTQTTLRILGAPDLSRDIKATDRLLPGTLSGLRSVGASDAFYWIPCATSFPGIDSVLGDETGEIYAMQETIAEDHRSPDVGLKVWKALPSDVRTHRRWNLVFVADSRQHAEARRGYTAEGLGLCHWLLKPDRTMDSMSKV